MTITSAIIVILVLIIVYLASLLPDSVFYETCNPTTLIPGVWVACPEFLANEGIDSAIMKVNAGGDFCIEQLVSSDLYEVKGKMSIPSCIIVNENNNAVFYTDSELDDDELRDSLGAEWVIVLNLTCCRIDIIDPRSKDVLYRMYKNGRVTDIAMGDE